MKERNVEAMPKSKSLRLTESAIMLAFATILSLLKVVDLPYGGSITAFSMLPILIIAYRYGTAWGVFTAFADGLLQMLTGMNSLSYATSAGAAAAIIVLDYLLAFAVLGLAGLFRRPGRSQGTSLALAAVITGALRYLCHVLSGCTVWAGLSIPSQDALLYSLAYNATYMVPEILLTVVGALAISRVLDFGSDSITRVPAQAKRPDLAALFSGLSKTAVVAAVVWDVKEIAFRLQNGETGEFDITGILQVNWLSVTLVTIVCAALAVGFHCAARRVPDESALKLGGLFSAIPFLLVAGGAAFGGYLIHGALADIRGTVWETLDSLLAGELAQGDAVQGIVSAASSGWLQILVIIACLVAALILVSLRYAAKRRSRQAA